MPGKTRWVKSLVSIVLQEERALFRRFVKECIFCTDAQLDTARLTVNNEISSG